VGASDAVVSFRRASRLAASLLAPTPYPSRVREGRKKGRR